LGRRERRKVPESDHSLSHGHRTDIVSGDPVEEKPTDGKEKKLAKLQERHAKHEATVADFRSEKGKLIIEKIHEALDRRVDELIEEDATAKALMDVLRSIGVEVVVTRRIAEQMKALQRQIERA